MLEVSPVQDPLSRLFVKDATGRSSGFFNHRLHGYDPDKGSGVGIEILYLSVRSVVKVQGLGSWIKAVEPGIGSVGDAFDTQHSMLKIEQERDIEVGDIEIANHLSDVGFVKNGRDLGIHDHGILNDKVRNQGTNKLAVVEDVVGLLLLAAKALFAEFYDQGALVKLFVKTGLECVEDSVGGADDYFGQFRFRGHRTFPISRLTQIQTD